MTAPKISLFIALIATGFCAGLFYAYSCSVNPGLGKLSDRNYVLAMQSINKEIQNPVFFASFFGALVLIPVSAWLNYPGKVDMRFLLIVIAALVYAIGTFGTTVVGNVPLNEKLAVFDASGATEADFKLARQAFESSWNAWHFVRTVASVMAFGLLAWASVSESD